MTPRSSYIGALIIQIGKLVKLALPLAGAIALLVFLWGLAIFIFKDDKKAEGRNRMVWGIIALFVLVSVWGLVGLLGQILLGNSTGVAPTENPCYDALGNPIYIGDCGAY